MLSKRAGPNICKVRLPYYPKTSVLSSRIHGQLSGTPLSFCSAEKSARHCDLPSSVPRWHVAAHDIHWAIIACCAASVDCAATSSLWHPCTDATFSKHSQITLMPAHAGSIVNDAARHLQLSRCDTTVECGRYTTIGCTCGYASRVDMTPVMPQRVSQSAHCHCHNRPQHHTPPAHARRGTLSAQKLVWHIRTGWWTVIATTRHHTAISRLHLSASSPFQLR